MYYHLPFPRAKSNDELEKIIMNYNRAEWLVRYENWMKEDYGSFDDGHASERFVERLKLVIEK